MQLVWKHVMWRPAVCQPLRSDNELISDKHFVYTCYRTGLIFMLLLSFSRNAARRWPSACRPLIRAWSSEVTVITTVALRLLCAFTWICLCCCTMSTRWQRFTTQSQAAAHYLLTALVLCIQAWLSTGAQHPRKSAKTSIITRILSVRRLLYCT